MVNIVPISIVPYKYLKEDLKFNAEYYKSEYQKIEKILEKNKYYTQLFNVAKKSKERFNPLNNPQKEFYYIEIDDVDINNGRYTYEKIKNYQAPSRARKLLDYEDVFISTVRPNRNAVSIFLKKENNFVCSTGFSVIKPQNINSYFLFIFLKTKYSIGQLVRRTSAAMYPAVSEDDIMDLKLINPPQHFQELIEKKVKSVYEKQQLANKKYEEAKEILETEIKFDKAKLQTELSTIIKHSDFVSAMRIDAQFFSSNKLKSLFLASFDSKSLNVLCEKIETGLTPAKNSYCRKGYPVLKMGCLTNFGIDWSKIEFANEAFFKRAKKFIAEEEEIFLTSSAHSLEHIAKKIDIVLDVPEEFKNKLVFVGEIMRLHVKKSLINPYYLLLFLKTELGYRLLQNCIRGHTAHIYPKDVEKISIPKISEEKQEKIEDLIKDSHGLMGESTKLIKESVNEVEKILLEQSI